MKPIVFINCTNFTGGTGSLSLFISKYFLDREYYVIQGYKIIDDASNYEELKNIGVDLIEISKSIDEIFKLKKLIHRIVYCISFSIFDYLEAAKLTLKQKSLRNVLYIVHPYNLVPRKGSIIFQKVYKLLFRSLYYKILKRNTLIFMDEDCAKRFEIFFNIPIDRDSDIRPLPHFMREVVWQKNDSQKSQIINILTIFRASFPFKGYIFGLLDQFNRLSVDHPEVRLNIITYGDQEHELRTAIDILPYQIRQKINLIGKVPHSTLHEYFKNAYLYVGMGYTLIEASSYGIPALPVKYFTYECLSGGFLVNNPMKLHAEGEQLVPTEYYIKKILCMSEDDLLSLSKRSIEIVKKYYNCENFFSKLIISWENCNFKPNLSERIRIMIFYKYFKIKNLLRMIRKFYAPVFKRI